MEAQMAINIKPFIDAFNKQVDRSKANDCWEWKGSKIKKGYGQIFRRIDGIGISIHTHRLAYEIYHGKIPKGMCVLHSCDNRSCCNPRHLFLGTNKDNINDMVLKNRNIKGETHPLHKLLEKDILLIRLSKDKTKDLSIIYNVHPSTIRRIRSKKSWRHI